MQENREGRRQPYAAGVEAAEAVTVTRQTAVSCESSTEYTLPDYMGDVRRVLHSEAMASPATGFVGEGSAEFSGVVAYRVLYVNADGQLEEAEFTSEYDFSVPVGEHAFAAHDDTRVTSFSVRPMGPRRFHAKSCLRSTVDIEESGVSVAPKLPEGSERQTATLNVMQRLHGESEEREYAQVLTHLAADMATSSREEFVPRDEQAPGEGDGWVDEVRILSAGGYITVQQAQAVSDGVLLSGTMELSAIVTTPGQPPFAITRSVPFEEKIAILGGAEDMQASGRAQLCSVTASVNPDAEGAEVVLHVVAEFAADAFAERAVPVVTDAYLPGQGSTQEYGQLQYARFCGTGCEQMPLSATVAREDWDSDCAREVLLTHAHPVLERVETGENGARAIGRVELHAVCCGIGEHDVPVYTVMKTGVPFALSLPCQMGTDGCLTARVDVQQLRGTLDASGLLLEGTLAVCWEGRCEQTVQSVTALSPVPREAAPAGHLTVYYPAAGETLWEIGKRFCVPVGRLAEENGGEEACLSRLGGASGGGGGCLLIPEM